MLMNMNLCSKEDRDAFDLARSVIAAILILIFLAPLVPGHAESVYDDYDYNNSDIILDGAEYIGDLEDEEAFPVITSVGKSNVKVNGTKSKVKLIRYTIPEVLLRSDPDFLALMIEAEKYIGYPYVYGGSKPSTSFDCSGFVCWVFRKSGVYNTGRVGANGLYSMCKPISREEARPGDLVFFEKTMGSDVKGITHVGIYVGNDMMIHAGDPIGFADLKSEKWAKKIYGFGRLPID